ncbi:DUF2804 domain-containing protein [Bermanella sp. R86510]|uniref:DUF2804 domain-containing protein n=1 Tax=unclassified Bermanella TaxID=2627862 RepID=UPI0037CC8D36
MQQLIDSTGQIDFGCYPNSPETINYMDFDLRNNMDKPLSKWRKYMGFNQFQFIAITGDDFILGVALVHLKWVSNCFAYIYQPSTKQFKEYSYLKPFGLGLQTSLQPNAGCWRFKSGNNQVDIQSTGQSRRLKVSLGALRADATILEPEHVTPLSVCCAAGYSGWQFTQKQTALEVSGRVRWREHTYDCKDMLASVDWSCGHMRRETSWRWASVSTFSSSGAKVGLNLAAGVNETSHTENALWIDNRFIKLDRAQFKFNRSNRMQEWFVTSSDGRVDLRFEPEGERKEKVNAVLIASNFTQLFGRFYGTVKDTNGDVHTINGALGFCEDHYAKW